MYAEIPSRPEVGKTMDGPGANLQPSDRYQCVECGSTAIHAAGKCRYCYARAWASTKPPCKYEGCPNHAFARGYCKAHYHQLRSGRELHELRNKVRLESADVSMLEFRREQVEYELRLERDAYRCSITVAARLFHRSEVVRLESLLIPKGGA